MSELSHILGSKIADKIINETLSHPRQAKGRAVRSNKKLQTNRTDAATSQSSPPILPVKLSHQTGQQNPISAQKPTMRTTNGMVTECRIRLTTQAQRPGPQDA